MMNGLTMPAGSKEAEAIEFDDLKANGVASNAGPAKAAATATAAAGAHGSTAKRSEPTRAEVSRERRRQTQEEYRQKRDADPTFVPNRGGFFMHDHRHPGPAANGFRPFGRGRGRGRPANGGPSPGPR